MKILAISIWALGVIVMCLFFYLSWYRWALFRLGLPKRDAKRKVIELALLLIGSGLLITGTMIFILPGP